MTANSLVHLGGKKQCLGPISPMTQSLVNLSSAPGPTKKYSRPRPETEQEVGLTWLQTAILSKFQCEC